MSFPRARTGKHHEYLFLLSTLNGVVAMRLLGQADMIRLWRRTLPHTSWVLLLASYALASAQTSQLTSLNGTWDFAFAGDAAAADRLASFYQDGFTGGAFSPIRVPSNWALQGFEEPIYRSEERRVGE